MLEIDRPQIFPPEIIAVVSRRNLAEFPPVGFSPGGMGALENYLELESHRQALAVEMNMSRDSLKFQRQVHGAEVVTMQRDSAAVDADGMIASETGLALCISIADCGAVLLFDPLTRAIGALHSGWRGTHLNIVQKGLAAMMQHFGAKPESMLAYISPCAGGAAYQVQEDIAVLFPQAITVAPDGTLFLDIRAEIRRQLLDCGVPAGQIESSGICTITDTQYHSYRRDREKSGRMAALIAMKPD